MLLCLLGYLSAPTKILLTVQGQVSLPRNTCLNPLPVSPAPSPSLCRPGHRLFHFCVNCPMSVRFTSLAQHQALGLVRRDAGENFPESDGMRKLNPTLTRPCWTFLSHESGFQVTVIHRQLLIEEVNGWPKEMYVLKVAINLRCNY